MPLPQAGVATSCRRLSAITTCALAAGAALPLDSVARFHLRNGARLEQINWPCDRSAERLRQSAGFLVNHVYDPRSIERNHEDYVKNHRIVASRAVRRLLWSGRRSRGDARHEFEREIAPNQRTVLF